MTNTRHPASATASHPGLWARHFTLIELSIVLLILSIMLTAGMPALTSLAQGRSVDTAARTLQSTLRQARMQAITGRQYVAVLLPTSGNLKVATMGAEGGYTSYRICTVSKPTADSANYKADFAAWLQGSKMEYIPTGSLIGYVTDSLSLGSDNCDSVTMLSPPMTLTDALIFTNTCRAVIFKPSGRIRQSVNLYVHIVEGAGTPSTSTKNSITIRIEATTGKASIVEAT